MIALTWFWSLNSKQNKKKNRKKWNSNKTNISCTSNYKFSTQKPTKCLDIEIKTCNPDQTIIVIKYCLVFEICEKKNENETNSEIHVIRFSIVVQRIHRKWCAAKKKAFSISLICDDDHGPLAIFTCATAQFKWPTGVFFYPCSKTTLIKKQFFDFAQSQQHLMNSIETNGIIVLRFYVTLLNDVAFVH